MGFPYRCMHDLVDDALGIQYCAEAQNKWPYTGLWDEKQALASSVV